MSKIQSVEKGVGEESTFFSTANNAAPMCKVDEIKCEEQFIGKGEYGDRTLDHYNCYRDGELLASIEAGHGITVIFESQLPEGEDEIGIR